MEDNGIRKSASKVIFRKTVEEGEEAQSSFVPNNVTPPPEVLLSMRNAYEDKPELISTSFLVPKLNSKDRINKKPPPEKVVYGAIELDSDAITSSERESFTFYGG